MDQSVGTAQIDERTEISQRRDAAVANFAGLQLREQAVLLLGATFLRRCALGQDEPIAAAVHLDDLEVERLAAHRAQLVLDLFRVCFRLQVTPADLGAGAIDRDDRPTVRVFGNDDDRRDVVSALQRQLATLVLDLTGGDDGFHFAADVDQDLVTVDEHDRALNQLTTPQLGVLRLFVLFEQCAHVLGVVAELRARLYVLSPGYRSCLLLGAFLRLVHSVQNELPTFALLLKLPFEYTGTCP